jgi:hypothetical protein
MLPSHSQSKFAKFVQKVEFKLVLFIAYVLGLICVWIYSRQFLPVIIMHLFFILIVAIIYFWEDLLVLVFSPLILILMPIQRLFIKRYLAKFNQNEAAEVVIILGHPNWFMLQGWLKHILMTSDIKSLVEYLEAKKQNFSFYPTASIADVEKIMSDKNIKEVYFFGHGNSHGFELSNDEFLYYCEFNNPKYQKEYVHQVHCGDPDGKSLVDYVVPEENRDKCFFFRKPINSLFILREFKRRKKELTR